MSEPGRPEKRTVDPDDVSGRRKAEGIGRAIGERLPTDGDGFGPLGEQVVRYRLTPENEGDPEDKRDIVWFTTGWRAHIRRMSNAHLDAVYTRASADIEHGIIVKWRWRIAKWVTGAVGAVLARLALKMAVEGY